MKNLSSGVLLSLLTALLILSLFFWSRVAWDGTMPGHKSAVIFFTSSSASEFRSLVKKYEERLPQEIPIDVVEDYYERIGPEVMLNILDENPFCHEQGHTLGRVIFERTGDFEKAMDICGLHCGQGCFHGIITAMLNNQTDDIHKITSENSSDFKNFVLDFCSIAESSNQVSRGTCYHGLGHAFMILANDNLSAAIEACTSFSEFWDGFYCAGGVYMQYYMDFGSDGQPYPCLESPYPAACFRYKFTYTHRSPLLLTKQMQTCMNLTRSYQLACLYGVGHGYENFVRSGAIDIHDLCAGDKEQVQMCLDGVIISVSFYDKQKAISLCAEVDEDYREYCMNDTNILDHPLNRSSRNYAITEN